jgi:DNA-binding MurR/RpiR family transcriptional regulator
MTTVLADIDRRIADAADVLTPTERRIATVLAGDPTAVAFLTVADLADRVDTSPPSVVRFATKLGFSGYGELQASAQRDLAATLSTPTERINHRPQDDTFGAAHQAVTDAVSSTFSEPGRKQLQSMAAELAKGGGAVWIVASETSSPVAHILAANLRLIRPGVRHLEGSAAAVAATVVEASPGDVVIAIDFERYESAVVRTVTELASRGASVLALTDGPLSPLAALADQWLAITVPAVGPFDSALPVLAVIEALTAEVAVHRRPDAAARLRHIEDSWSAYQIFEGELS